MTDSDSCTTIAKAGTQWPSHVLRGRVRTRVTLAFVDQRVNVWLRFGRPSREVVLDRWRRVAVLDPGTICCRVKWIAGEQGTLLWQLAVLQAPAAGDAFQRVAGVLPGARILLRADSAQHVKTVLALIDATEHSGIDPSAVAEAYWRTVGNRLAARLPLPAYTSERHAAHLLRKAVL